MQIPKCLHMIWVGDESKRPDQWISTWRDHHADWDLRVWGNDDYHATDWVNHRHLQTLWERQSWHGVSDLMRYEILYRHGGVYMDADTTCLRPLDDWLLEGEFFAAWQTDIGLRAQRFVANAFLGSKPENWFLRYLIDHIRAMRSVTTQWSWRYLRHRRAVPYKTVGPAALTLCLRKSGYTGATLLPAHMFNPEHRGLQYSGGGRVYAVHFGGTTNKLYKSERRAVAAPRPASCKP